MKKPNPKVKAKAQARKAAPKDALIVDYGTTRVIMPFKVSLATYYLKDINLMGEWCQANLAADTWKISAMFPGWIYFVHEQDTTLFRLRWEHI